MAERDEGSWDAEWAAARALRHRYRSAGAGEAPPAHVDDAILAASRRAVGAGPGGVRRWHLPLAAAAVIVAATSLSLVFHETGKHREGFEAPLPAHTVPARPESVSDDAGTDATGDTSPATLANAARPPSPGAAATPGGRQQQADTGTTAGLARAPIQPPAARAPEEATAVAGRPRPGAVGVPHPAPLAEESMPDVPAAAIPSSVDQEYAPARPVPEADPASAAAPAAPAGQDARRAVAPASPVRAKAAGDLRESVDEAEPAAPPLPAVVPSASSEAPADTAPSALARRAVEPGRLAARMSSRKAGAPGRGETDLAAIRALWDSGRHEEARRALARLLCERPDTRIPPDFPIAGTDSGTCADAGAAKEPTSPDR